MKTQYRISTTEGDMPLGPRERELPFKTGWSSAHPFLTLGDYFEALEACILRNFKALVPFLKAGPDKTPNEENVSELLIRSEKHGALYHISYVEIFTGDASLKLAVSTAATDTARTWLRREFTTLVGLEKGFHLHYLPKVYLMDEIFCHSGSFEETLVMCVSEWLEGFNEWHLSYDGATKTNRIEIWDTSTHNRFALDGERFQIIREASGILTEYYNTRSFCRIHPWRHAAGDFVVRIRKGEVDVRLTTARHYEPLSLFPSGQQLDGRIALVYFFLELAVRMRVDKLDGVGATAWMEDFAVTATVEGFFRALSIRPSADTEGLESVKEVWALLSSFSEDELLRLHEPLMEIFQQEEEEYVRIIQDNLQAHVRCLHHALKTFSP